MVCPGAGRGGRGARPGCVGAQGRVLVGVPSSRHRPLPGRRCRLFSIFMGLFYTVGPGPALSVGVEARGVVNAGVGSIPPFRPSLPLKAEGRRAILLCFYSCCLLVHGSRAEGWLEGRGRDLEAVEAWVPCFAHGCMLSLPVLCCAGWLLAGRQAEALR